MLRLIDMNGKPPTWTVTVATPAGLFTATFTERGLKRLSFPAHPPLFPSTCPSEARGRIELAAATPPIIGQWRELMVRALAAYFGKRKPDRLPPFDFQPSSLFAQAVWRALMEIPRGQTRSYGEIAAVLGRPNAARAVGQACGANPIPILIPCHRVLAANRRIGGFSGGLAWKYCLLELEGITVGEDRRD
jgi:methylated-DNA-[protein]-cysteine S-methyltransferase